MYLHTFHIDKVRHLRDLIAPSSSQYVDMREINSYIENYKYKYLPAVGDTFFEFKARWSDGTQFDSHAINDKVIVLFFWYSGCGPCKRVIEPLNRLLDKYRSKGLEIISYATDDDEAVWKKTCSQYHFPGSNVSELMGFSAPIANHYGLNVFPSFVVFDKNKKIVLMTYGEEIPLIASKVDELVQK